MLSSLYVWPQFDMKLRVSEASLSCTLRATSQLCFVTKALNVDTAM